MKIKIAVLRAALNQLMDYAEEMRADSVEIDEDYYWFVPQTAVYDPTTEPTELTLGSLADDWKATAEIGVGEKEPFGYAMVWASTVLRAIGDKVA